MPTGTSSTLMAAREYGLEAVEAACAEALTAGACTSAVILNLVARLATPETLVLGIPPVADFTR